MTTFHADESTADGDVDGRAVETHRTSVIVSETREYLPRSPDGPNDRRSVRQNRIKFSDEEHIRCGAPKWDNKSTFDIGRSGRRDNRRRRPAQTQYRDIQHHITRRDVSVDGVVSRDGVTASLRRPLSDHDGRHAVAGIVVGPPTPMMKNYK